MSYFLAWYYFPIINIILVIGSYMKKLLRIPFVKDTSEKYDELLN